ncbi:outer membrane beta-barrel protein [Helicobacter sp. faydin-H20]|uniref:outer membrane beta-barrel protein n=1 Tax=Helicobacter anatolicus TaxID=2905874 RepID=UPI001E5DC46C|nr:outer membrane beta-barrel protein [Helicobacter anatolicus]MCE3037136.1 outer membrane beta-barrel protein [Helicobacter anatolicus]
MKKIMALPFFGALCLAQGNFFVGGGIGAPASFGTNAGITTRDQFIHFNIKGGYEFQVNEKHGFRTYLDLGYGIAPVGQTARAPLTSTTTKVSLTSHLVDFDLNLDYLYRFVNTEKYSVGLYAGIFMGMLYTNTGGSKVTTTVGAAITTTTTTGIDTISYNTGFNLGFEGVIAKKHSILMGIKFLGDKSFFNGLLYLAPQINYLYRF